MYLYMHCFFSIRYMHVVFSLFLLFSLTATGKTIIVRNNLPIEDQFKYRNTTYVINEIIDLKGKKVTIPARSKIEFKGGRLYNGVLIGNSTKFKGSLEGVFSDVQFSGSFWVSDISYEWFSSYFNDTFLLHAMLDLLFSMNNRCTLTLQKGRLYDVSGPRLEYGHALFEFYNKMDKIIRGNGAIINDLRPRSLVGYNTYDGVFLFYHCDNIIIHDLNYQNLNEDYDVLYDEQGHVKYQAGIENQLGYVGTSYILLQNNCSSFDIKTQVVGARYGIKVGDYSKYWLSGDKGLTNSKLHVFAKRTGYPVAIELGDNLDIAVISDTHHRAAYICGLSNSVVSIKAKNILIAPFHCLLSDTHYAKKQNAPIRYKACSDLDVSVTELGSSIVTNNDAYCIGFQTYNTGPFHARRKPLVWSNINVKVKMLKEAPNVGLFSFSWETLRDDNAPLGLHDVFKNISISAKTEYPSAQYSARLRVGEAARYNNISIQIDAPEGIVIYNNRNDYEFDLSSSSMNLIFHSGKVILPKKVKSKQIKF